MAHAKARLVLLLALVYVPLSCGSRIPKVIDRTDPPVFAVCQDENEYDRDEKTIAAGTSDELVVGREPRLHTLRIPANALEQDTRFTLEQAPGPVVQINVRSDPQQTFANDVVLTLSFVGCRPGAKAEETLEFLRMNPQTGIWEKRGGTNLSPSGGPKQVVLRTKEFSSYVLAAAD